MKTIIAFLLTALLCAQAFADKKMYIDDQNFVPLRSGQGLEYRIIHRGLPSGTKVDVLQDSADSGYSLVREPGGLEGWLPTRYLTPDPIARDQLKAMQKDYDQMKADNARITSERQAMVQETQRLTAENAKLTSANKDLTEELQRIKRISENAIALDQRNQELRESNQQLKNDTELLTAENMRLKENSDTDKMLVGAGLVGVGILIALLVPLMKPKKKSSW